MKKLEDIPKKRIFEVPEGYFEELPSRVQARISSPERGRQGSWAVFALRYALPVLLAVAVFTVWRVNTGSSRPETYEEILASIDTDALVNYLEESDITTDELLQSMDLNGDDVTEIENEVYDILLDDEDLDVLLEEYSYELDN